MSSAEDKNREEFRRLFIEHYPDIVSGKKPIIVSPSDMPKITFSPELEEKLARFDPSTLTASGTVTVSIPWSDPASNPLKDLMDAYVATGDRMHKDAIDSLAGSSKSIGEFESYTGLAVNRYPRLKYCGKCGSKRTERVDPWALLKRCPTCGYVDPVPSISTSSPDDTPAPTTISWPEVQRLLVGILRQVEDNKVQVHPSEFDLTGITFYQETDPATGIVTLWFEKAD